MNEHTCPNCGSTDLMDTGCGLTCNNCGWTQMDPENCEE